MPAWAGTSVLATDNCTRGDNADLGAAWDPNLATFKIAGNLCVSVGNGTDAAERNNSVAWPADQYAKGTMGSVATTVSGTGYGVGCRWDTTGTVASGYWLVGSTQGFEFAKWTTNTFASILKAGTTTFANTDTIELRCTGTGTVTLAGYKNGVLFSTQTDASSPFNTGYPAIAHSSTDAIGNGLSAWEGGSVTFGRSGHSAIVFP